MVELVHVLLENSCSGDEWKKQKDIFVLRYGHKELSDISLIWRTTNVTSSLPQWKVHILMSFKMQRKPMMRPLCFASAQTNDFSALNVIYNQEYKLTLFFSLPTFSHRAGHCQLRVTSLLFTRTPSTSKFAMGPNTKSRKASKAQPVEEEYETPAQIQTREYNANIANAQVQTQVEISILREKWGHEQAHMEMAAEVC